MALADLVSKYVPAVDGEMAAVLANSPGSQRIAPHLRYHLGWVDQEFQPLGPAEQRRYGGKRLRPILCLLAYRSLRDDWQRALPAAVGGSATRAVLSRPGRRRTINLQRNHQ